MESKDEKFPRFLLGLCLQLYITYWDVIFSSKALVSSLNKPHMIIKGLFRRYERWNPVHPTYGAFWGMGFGIGCGIGWGPGFGPEVIGYVGAGCGVGFSVGITLAGIGIGLPANFFYQIPYNALARARNCTLEFAQSTTVSSTKNARQYGWTQIGPSIAGFRNEAIGRFTNLKTDLLDHKLEFPDLTKNLSSHANSTLEHMKSLRDQFFPPIPGLRANDKTAPLRVAPVKWETGGPGPGRAEPGC